MTPKKLQYYFMSWVPSILTKMLSTIGLFGKLYHRLDAMVRKIGQSTIYVTYANCVDYLWTIIGARRKRTRQKMDKEFSFIIQGQKGILLQLDELKGNYDPDSPIYVPNFKDGHTDGGKIAAKIDNMEKYATIATVLQISDKAAELMKEDGMDIQIGDRVYVDPVAKHARNWFIPDRHYTVKNYTGMLLVHPNNIQAREKRENG